MRALSFGCPKVAAGRLGVVTRANGRERCENCAIYRSVRCFYAAPVPQPLRNPPTHLIAQRTAAWGSYTGRWYAPYQARTAALSARRFDPPAPPVDPRRPRWTVARIVSIALAILIGAAAVAVFQQWNVHLALGDRLAGLERTADRGGLAQALGNRLRAETGATGVVTAVYTGRDGDVLVAVGKRLTLRPITRCAPAADAEPDGTTCVWADHGTVGYAVFPGHAVPAAAALFAAMKEQAIVR
jgi:hypothetical protein